MSLPPAVAIGALYDSLLQAALRQFFPRASLSASPASPDDHEREPLAIEPGGSPDTLTIRWYGTRYTLHVPGRQPFTAHEVRLARAVGSVLAARYRAVLNPGVVGGRRDLFGGAVEDRYVGAFIDVEPYSIVSTDARANRIATVIELLRVAALSSYENRSISTGVLLLGTREDPCRPGMRVRDDAPAFSRQLTGIKGFYRLADGVRTLFLANCEGLLIDVVDVDRWATEVCGTGVPRAPCAQLYEAHARATLVGGSVCAVLSPSREIKLFAEGAELFAFRGAVWRLLDLAAKYQLWARAVGSEALANRLFQTALDLAEAREGALFAVLRDPAQGLPELVAPANRLDAPAPAEAAHVPRPSRRDLLHLLEARSATTIDASVLAALASLDGATVVDGSGRLLAAGAILRHPTAVDPAGYGVEGARTAAALAASRFGPVLKVSEDGGITFFDRERIWDI